MSARVATYLDFNAGAPPSPRVIEALLSFLSDPQRLTGNPSSTHSFGRKTKAILRDARDQVARTISADPTQIQFTSSGTESCQAAIRSVLESALEIGEKPHWILTAAEHDAVDSMTGWLEARGGSVSRVALDAEGRPKLEELESLLRPETRLVSAIWVHNETGVVTDIAELARILREKGRNQVRLHLDAAQAWGKLPIRVHETGADFLSFSGHKIGALSGTGFLWTRPGVTQGRGGRLFPGTQEGGRRGGTENFLGIASLGAASLDVDPQRYAREVGPLRDQLERLVLERIPGAILYGAGAPRVANTSLIGFGEIPSEALLMNLDLEGFAVSAGSACSSGVQGPSRVLQAMGVDERRSKSRLRISLHPGLGVAELEAFVGALARVVARLSVKT